MLTISVQSIFCYISKHSLISFAELFGEKKTTAELFAFVHYVNDEDFSKHKST